MTPSAAGKGGDYRPVDPVKWDREYTRLYGTEEDRKQRLREYFEKKRKEKENVNTVD